MRILLIFLIFIVTQGCSFDKKSGIWKNETNITNKEKDDFQQFKNITTANTTFKKEIKIKKNFNFILPSLYDNSEWKDIFFNQSNNSKNFKYSNLNRKSFHSKKITKNKVDNYILFENDNIISTDQSGNINIHSLIEKRNIYKFNFYKKRFKKNIKKLNVIVENGIIYASDNLGYLYSLNYKEKKILWAKNFKIPFRSNLKIFENKLILSDQNNQLFYINKNNGNILKIIPTEETTVKNKFINNISLNDNSTFFLNTFGSLYSIDSRSTRINWFINLNQASDINPTNLFLGNKLISTNNQIIVTSNYFTYVIDSNTGEIIYKKNFSSKIKPIVIDNYLFLISKNDFLICFDLAINEIIYSYDINKKISEFLKISKKGAEFKNILMLNNKLFIFLKNSNVLIFKINGDLEKIIKLPIKLNSQPILVEESLIYLDFKNKIAIIN